MTLLPQESTSSTFCTLAAQEPLQPAAYDQAAARAFVPAATAAIRSSFLSHSQLSVAASIHCRYLPRGLHGSFGIRAGLDQRRSQKIATLCSHHVVTLLVPSKIAPLAANDQKLSARESYVKVWNPLGFMGM